MTRRTGADLFTPDATFARFASFSVIPRRGAPFPLTEIKSRIKSAQRRIAIQSSLNASALNALAGKRSARSLSQFKKHQMCRKVDLFAALEPIILGSNPVDAIDDCGTWRSCRHLARVHHCRISGEQRHQLCASQTIRLHILRHENSCSFRCRAA